jgi:hypothetical protein
VSINFLHIAILIFAISVVVLVAVSLATQPETREKLRGLTFSTTDTPYGITTAPQTLRAQAAFSVVLALFVIGLWIWFA